MKIKYLPLIITALFFAVKANCQHQLYFENFEGSTPTFNMNDNTYGKNMGNNKWIINNVYTGAIGHPSTKSEDSTYGGSISYAPFGHYMHIYDSASAFKNDNYNPGDSSYRFAYMNVGICTKALTNINFNFFYLCQGSNTAFGRVVYSIDGGPWTPTSWTLNGDTVNNRYKWQYATITNAAFSNVEDVRFGFLWKNNKAAGTDTTAFGIDDVSIYGTYDSINHPINCKFSTVFSDSCLGGNAYIYVSAAFSDSTCDASWDFDVSNKSGGFSPPIVAYTYYIGPSYGNDLNAYLFASIPTAYVIPGQCYKVRVNRLSYPYLSFTDSVCFPLDTCPGTIQTLQPPATLDTNAVCAGSVIDVPFFSNGIYSIYNIYYCQLIDSIGNTAVIDTIGQLASNVAYPYPPGDVVSTIPFKVPAGCHYYVRVVCNTGNRPSTMWGPFCIQHCDIVTDSNTSQDLHACLASCSKQPNGWTDSIIYDIHKYDSLAYYNPGNKFKVQLIQFVNYPPSFAVINTGLLGVKVDTTSGKMYIHVPCPTTLFANGINPGVYYIRVVADSSNFTDSAFGTLVHLTIGEPADNLTLTLGTAGPYCTGTTITVYTNPDQEYSPYYSTYQWWVTDRKGTYPFNNYPYGTLNFYNTTGDTLIVTCQETNNGCKGNVAKLADTIVILGLPSVYPKGPQYLCVGDTGLYYVPFANNTSYIWTLPAKVHADTANNELKIRFDSVGTFKFTVLATNACYSNTYTWTVHVIAQPTPAITAVPSGAFCAGTSVVLSVTGATTYKWSTGSTKTTINVAPTKDSSYWVGASNKGCTIKDTIKLVVYPSPLVAATPSVTTICIGDTAKLTATGGKTYNWMPDGGLNSNTDSVIHTIVTTTETYTVMGYSVHGCKDSATVMVSPLPVSGTLISTNTSINEGTSVTLSATGGGTYLWIPSTGLSCDNCPDPVASPSVTTTYTLVITDSNKCSVRESLTIDVIEACGTIFVPEAFSPNADGHNDRLYVRANCVSSCDFIVYDRWGNKVWETTDINLGWDGTYKGQPMNTGTYVYYAKIVNNLGKTITAKGNVALVR